MVGSYLIMRHEAAELDEIMIAYVVSVPKSQVAKSQPWPAMING